MSNYHYFWIYDAIFFCRISNILQNMQMQIKKKKDFAIKTNKEERTSYAANFCY